jgi:hypothetical protein
MKDKFYLLLCLLLIALVVWKIRYEIIDYFEEEMEDPYVLGLVKEIQGIDPRVQDACKRLKFYKGRRSYTINKQSVYICKADEHNVLYNKNQLMLVLIHEISHAINTTVGHDDSFKEILSDLLQKAEAKGLYNSKIEHVANYCNY